MSLRISKAVSLITLLVLTTVTEQSFSAIKTSKFSIPGFANFTLNLPSNWHAEMLINHYANTAEIKIRPRGASQDFDITITPKLIRDSSSAHYNTKGNIKHVGYTTNEPITSIDKLQFIGELSLKFAQEKALTINSFHHNRGKYFLLTNTQRTSEEPFKNFGYGILEQPKKFGKVQLFFSYKTNTFTQHEVASLLNMIKTARVQRLNT